MSQLIDFSTLGGPVFVGRAKGIFSRKQLSIDETDAAPGPVTIRIPADTYSVNSSFFLGMFGPSLDYFGSRESFMEHYRFEAPHHVMETLDSVMQTVLTNKDNTKLLP